MTAKPPFLPLPISKRRKVSVVRDDEVTLTEKDGDVGQELTYKILYNRNDSNIDKSIIVFDGALAKVMTTQAVRLPTHYVGVRRVRPSSKAVHRVFVDSQKFKQQQQEKLLLFELTNAISTSVPPPPPPPPSPEHDLSHNDVLKCTDSERIDVKESGNTTCAAVEVSESEPEVLQSSQENHLSMAVETSKATPAILISAETITSSAGVDSKDNNNHDMNGTRVNAQSLMASTSTLYRIVDPITGIQRRMNSKEKKELKLRLAQEKKAVKSKLTKIKVQVLEQRQKEASIIRKKQKNLEYQQYKEQQQQIALSLPQEQQKAQSLTTKHVPSGDENSRDEPHPKRHCAQTLNDGDIARECKSSSSTDQPKATSDFGITIPEDTNDGQKEQVTFLAQEHSNSVDVSIVHTNVDSLDADEKHNEAQLEIQPKIKDVLGVSKIECTTPSSSNNELFPPKSLPNVGSSNTSNKVDESMQPPSEINCGQRPSTAAALSDLSGLLVDVDKHSSKTNERKQQQRCYLQLEIDPAALEQELADLRGDRDGVPPVVIPPPLVNVALRYQQHLFIPSSSAQSTFSFSTRTNTRPQTDAVDVSIRDSSSSVNDTSIGRGDSSVTTTFCLDDNLALEWSLQLKRSMKPAELVRQQEDMRPMPYDLLPEVWKRLRPSNLISGHVLSQDERQHRQQHQHLRVDGSQSFSAEQSCARQNIPPASKHSNYVSNNCSEHVSQNDQCDHDSISLGDTRDPAIATSTIQWDWCCIRPYTDSVSSSFDNDARHIIELLYHGTDLHVACGAKFGCDYLIYDGPRNERHAFAGLRIMTLPKSSLTGNETEYSTETVVTKCNNYTETSTITKSTRKKLPRLTPYEMSSFVRCLNTAGKLALLATVVTDTTTIEKRTKFVYDHLTSNDNNQKNEQGQINDQDSSNATKITLTTHHNHRIAIIDLALEKVIATRSNRPKKTLEQRLQLLAKS